MPMYLATLLTAAALAAGPLCAAQANAGVGDVATASVHTHTGPRDAFTDGARSAQAGGMAPATLGRQGFSACVSRPFDPYQDGMRSGQTDPYASGGECLAALQPIGPATAPGTGRAA